jgi:hypothetical protein
VPLGPQDYVAAPQLTAPPNGLLRSALVVEHPEEEHWGGQLVWAPENGANAAIFDPCIGGPAGTFLDGVSTSGSATYTSATAAFSGADVGRPVTGINIPAGTTIVAVASPTSITLSANATATGTGLAFTVYGRLSPGNHPAGLTYTPFVVDAYDRCSAFGFEAADYEGRARRALAARETKAVEGEWWRGALFPANPHLDNTGSAPAATNTTALAAGAAQGLRTGLALLVQALADGNGGVGMIHARPFLVEQWFALYLISRANDGKLYTGAGNLVVPGAGYPGTGPTGQAVTATSEWAYATDAPEIHRGPVEVFSNAWRETVNRDLNIVTVRAERMYGIAWNAVMNNCCQINPTLTT